MHTNDQQAEGRIFLCHELAGRRTMLARGRNLRMMSWCFAAAKLFGLGDARYKISHIYVEFENVGSPGDVPVVPSYDTSDGIDYYENLSGDRDYLRVPIRGTPQISQSDIPEQYDEGHGDLLTVEALANGDVGMHSLEFSNGANSKVFGVGLVAAVDPTDRSQDVLLHRGYYESDKLKIVPATGLLLVGWDIFYQPG